MNNIETASRMMQTTLDVALWADGKITDVTALKKLAKDLQVLEGDTEAILLQIENQLPPLPEREK